MFGYMQGWRRSLGGGGTHVLMAISGNGSSERQHLKVVNSSKDKKRGGQL